MSENIDWMFEDEEKKVRDRHAKEFSQLQLRHQTIKTMNPGNYILKKHPVDDGKCPICASTAWRLNRHQLEQDQDFRICKKNHIYHIHSYQLYKIYVFEMPSDDDCSLCIDQ